MTTKRIPVTEQKAKEMEELARYVKQLFAFVRGRQIPKADAWDIVQETFVDICIREEPLPECPKQRAALLFQIAKGRILAYFSEQHRLLERAEWAREHAVCLGRPYQPDSAATLEAREQLELVCRELSIEQWQVFTDRALDEWTIAEIASRYEMNVNTTKTHWLQALELLREKLQHLEHRRIRGFLVVFGISRILAIAKNASAMGAMVRRFFQIVRLPLRGFVGGAAIAAVMLSPPNSGASADDFAGSKTATASPVSTTEIVQVETLSRKRGRAGEAIELPKGRSELPKRTVRTVVSSETAPKKLPMPAASPDYLIARAMKLLRDGKPEQALAVLAEYPVQDSMTADVEMVKSLRANAAAAIATGRK